MKITFNSPVILGFTIVCVIVQVLDNAFSEFTSKFFTVYTSQTFDYLNLLDYFRLFSHAIGHSGWEHLSGNFMFILAIGPIIEEKYGSKNLITMFLITAGITGLSNVIFMSNPIHGASGIVFMLILLGSITNIKDTRTIPMTFILIFALYLGKEIMGAMDDDKISQFAHILGGICGSIFGFTMVQEAKFKS